MWRPFLLRLLATFFGGSLALYLLLALADPWGTLPFPSPFPRQPADHSQRWAYPELARTPRFDAAIIGNSTSRLIDPADLDPATSATFVNLAMVHSFPFEQMQLLDVFLRAHPAPRALMIGIDRLWCERDDTIGHYGYDPVPDWLYRDAPLASLKHLFNLHAIETVWRSAATELGLATRPYGANGWQWIDVDHHPYDPVLAHSLIAENLAEPWLTPASPDPATWNYIALDWLHDRTARLPATTRLLYVFVPHNLRYPVPGTVGAAMIAECHHRLVEAARARPNTAVYDLSMPNPLTQDETVWWDAVHMRPEPMARLSHDLGAAIAGTESPDVRTVLTTPPATSVSAR